jgi:hypothetical protein
MTTRDENMKTWCRNLMDYCLFRGEEIKGGKVPEEAVLVEGIATSMFGFHPGRIEEKKPEIKELLDRMPVQFHAQSGGGWSFLNLCNDKSGDQWTDYHRDMEILVVLGLAAKLAAYTMPRDLWDSLPGGVPYITIDTRDKSAEPKKEEEHEPVSEGVGEQSPHR